MGFFSSRKIDGDIVVHDREGSKTVVQVIRSRFYGRNKGTERGGEDISPGTFISQDSSVASTLGSQPSLRKSQSASFSLRRIGRNHNNNTHSSTNLRGHSERSGKAAASETTSTRNSGIFDTSFFSTSSSTHYNDKTSISPAGTSTASVSASTSARPSIRTDTVTMTLAQRLNELAVANDEGLLNDDEYRLLRQNLFERFAGNVTVPTENSVVPATVPRSRHPQRGNTVSESRTSITSSRLSSNFNIDLPNSSNATRTPSIRSTQNSVKSGVANILNRATGRGLNRNKSDTSSIYSINSTTSSAFPSTGLRSNRAISVNNKVKRKTSNSSIGTEPAADTFSLSSKTSRKTSGTGLTAPSPLERSPVDGYPYSPQTPSRSAASSLRKLAVPPSSFTSPKSGKHNAGGGERLQDIFDDANLVSSADIKKEMAAVEAEGRSLMDAFNGLEVTTLAKRHQGHNRRPSTVVLSDSPVAQAGAGTWTLMPDSKLHFRHHLDTDATSIRSGTSAHTARSVPRSANRDGRALPSKHSMGSVSASTSLHRKNSSSSLASSTVNAKRRLAAPPVPGLPSNLGQLAHASNSSLNLTRSTGHLPMSSVPEDKVKTSMENNLLEVDEEMEEIRRRREDVSRRYEERLEYLRAKLKGAQLHEKLMKK